MSNENEREKPETSSEAASPVDVLVMPGKNKLYWAYNLPLQVWPKHKDPGDSSSSVVGHRLVNYMARKECCCELELDEDTLGGQTREEFFNTAADILENLAGQMRKCAAAETDFIYYPDDGMVEA